MIYGIMRKMLLKLLQLNCESGRFLDELTEYIKKNDFDIVNLQEVSSKTLNKYHTDLDLFKELKKRLGFKGELTKTISANDEDIYFGNATLFKPEFSLVDKNVVWLKPFAKYSELPKDHFEDLPRNALHLTLLNENKKFNIINTHLAWGITPLDEQYKVDQANILFNYLKTVSTPFILTGDFNVTPQTQVIRKFNSIARNLTVENKIKNTLNAQTHRVEELFPPGLAVDYVFVTRNLKINSFEVVEEKLSDHLGLKVELEI